MRDCIMKRNGCVSGSRRAAFGRGVFAVAVAVAVALAVSACSKVQTIGDGAARHAWTIPHVLRISTTEDIGGLNPHISQLTMAWLVRVDRANRLVPELATQVPTIANRGISADGRTITFHLRRGVVWSDGAPFDANDVAFTTKTVLDPRTNEGSRYGFDAIESFRVIDRYTFAVRLRQPYAPFLMQFYNSGGTMCLLPAHLLATLPTINAAPYNALPVGIGPFRYVAWKRGDAVEMEANPRYFRGRPKLARIIYKILPDRNTLFAQMQAHELDVWPAFANVYDERLRATPGVVTLHKPSFTLQYLVINTMTGHPGADLAVRRALHVGIDRREIARTVLRGLGHVSDAFFPAAHPMHHATPFVEYDLLNAKRLLDGAGWRVGSDGMRSKAGRRFTLLAVTATGYADIDQMFELMRANLRALGIGLEIRHYPSSIVFGSLAGGGVLARGAFDISALSQALDAGGDISANFACHQKPPIGFNFGRFCDAELDADLTRFNSTYDSGARRRVAESITRRLAQTVPAVVINGQDDLFALNADVRGFSPNGTSFFDNFMDVDL
jgi:peptide/nickel transport system substrate-binding protein